MNLSKRLIYIASFVDSSMILADIGSDHGYLPYYLLKEKIISKAYASDNKKGPYLNLIKTFKDSSFNIECALKDGLDNLPNYVNTLCFTGMGTDLIIKIISAHLEVLSQIDQMIISPHSKIDKLRDYLQHLGFKIIDEGLIFDDKFYHVLKYQKGHQVLSKKEILFGPILLKKHEQIFLEYLLGERKMVTDILIRENLSLERKLELEQYCLEIDEVLNEYAETNQKTI